jgi:hypothetical protein
MSYFASEEEANELGYHQLKTFADGSQAALTPMMFTTAIVSGINRYGYEDRWCYHKVADAIKALAEWDGTGEPKGWHRHPSTGRRVDENGEMYVRA